MATNNADNTNIGVGAAKEVTRPVQPAFGAYADDQTNVTGDATNYTVLWANEIFDQGSNFATNTFTAPVTGRYQLNMAIQMTGIGSTHTVAQAYLNTSNRNYSTDGCNVYVAAGNGYFTFMDSQLADMDAADTATTSIYISATNKTCDVVGAGTFFNGYLAC